MTAAGEVVWVGVEPIGDRDGRIVLYLAEHQQRLMPPDAIRLKPDACPDHERLAGARHEQARSHRSSN